MPNVISRDRRSVTFLENRKVIEWMEAMARARKTDLSVILREATSAYYLQHQAAANEPSLFARRSATKAGQRAKTARDIAAGVLSLAKAQERNAPIHQPVRVLELWPSIRRHIRDKSA